MDLLPDRAAQTFATWLKAHPGVEVVSRDRGGDEAIGAREGAPDATQVADRFHLFKNLGALAERVLRRHASAIQQHTASSCSVAPAPARPEREATRRQVQARVRSRYEAIQALAAKGMSGQAIAPPLGIHRHTVERTLRLPTCPERARHPRKPHLLDSYAPYLRARWGQGYRNGLGLWRELVAQGYPGTSQHVSRFVTALRQQEQNGNAAAGTAASSGTTDGTSTGPPCAALSGPRGLTPREAVGLLLHQHEDLTAEQQTTRAILCQVHPEMAPIDVLLSRFRQVVRDHDAGGRAVWLEEAAQSGMHEVRAFVTKLRQDLPAVQAAVTSPWSQGQVEGQVNRLKLVKRSMYGRANFDLFRQRALYHPAAA